MSRPIIITIRLPVETQKTENGVIVTCQFLGISRGGDTTGEAMENLSSSLTGYFGSLFDLGRFDLLFHSYGYSALTEGPAPTDGRFLDIRLKLANPRPEVTTHWHTRDVPLSLLASQKTVRRV